MSEPASGQTPFRLAAAWHGPEGAPALVLGNSLGTTARLWAEQLPALAEHFRVLSYEHPGHGGSPAPAGPYTVADLAGGVLSLLDEAGVASAAYCGVSLGGMVGMWLAAHAPDRITALGLCCTSAYLPPAQGWLDRAAAARSGGTASIAGQVVSRWFTPGYAARHPLTVREFTALLSDVADEGYAGCCEAIAAMDLRPALPRITARTLVLAGAEDPATPPWHAAVIASGIPGARLRVIRGGAHLANVSAAPEATAALLSHLGDLR